MGRIRRVYYLGELSPIIEIDESQSRKLKTVLRAEQGDIIEILTQEYLAAGEIHIAGKKSIHVRIIEKRPVKLINYTFKVYQCITKREYMDFMVEKYSELGVTHFIPVVSARSFESLKPSAVERYNNISLEAALQCEREEIMHILPSIKLEKIRSDSDDNILFHERLGEKAIPKITTKNISIIIGPEGGFTEKEYSYLVDAGFKAYTPLDTILKAETAAVLFAGMVRLNI